MSRHDLYGPIHKGLRFGLSRLLVRIGSADFSDAEGSRELLADVEAQLAISAAHLLHEEQFIHGLLEERRPGSTADLVDAHDHHGVVLDEIGALLERLKQADDASRPLLGRALYIQFSQFVADDFQHMAEEETRTLPLLHMLFSDEELVEIEGRIVQSLSPEEVIGTMSLIIPALSHVERVGMLGELKASAPSEAFEAVMRFAAEPSLEPQAYAALQEALTA